MRRILHISKYYHPYIGGVETVCRQLAENTPDAQCAVVCFNSGKRDYEDEVNGIKVYRVGSWVNISRQALSPTYFTVLRKAIREFKPDIIHFHWANPFPAAVLLCLIPKDVKLIVHWHMDIIKQKYLYHLIKPVESALLKRADMILTTSPQYRSHSIPLQPFQDKIKILPNAIEESRWTLREGDEHNIMTLKQEYGQKPIVLFVGRHIQYKGLPCLIEAERYVKSDCVFIIAGDGPLTPGLKASCNSPRVIFTGRLSEDQLRWYQYAASVFAFPSVSKNEAFGLALADAMYCQTPAVTFTIEGSGVNWVNLDGVTGIEAPNGDARTFATAIDRLLQDKDLAASYGIAAKKRILDNFTLPRMLETYSELLSGLK